MINKNNSILDKKDVEYEFEKYNKIVILYLAQNKKDYQRDEKNKQAII